MRPKYLRKILIQSTQFTVRTTASWGRPVSMVKTDATNNQRSLWTDLQRVQCVRQHLCTTPARTKNLQEERRSCQHFSQYSGSKWHHWHRMVVESLRPSLFLLLSSDLRISDVFPDRYGLWMLLTRFSNSKHCRRARDEMRTRTRGWGGSGQDFNPWRSCPRGTSSSLRTHSTWTACLCVCMCPAWEAEKRLWLEASTQCPCAYLSSTISCLSVLPAPQGPPLPKSSQIEQWPCMFPSPTLFSL